MKDENKDNLIIGAFIAFVIATICLSLLAGIWVQARRDVEIAKIKASAPQEEVAK